VNPREDVLRATWLAGRYQVAGLQARGALCQVYQGQDAVLQRPIAIKAPSAAHAEMYRASLALTATLAHPAFLALYDVIEQEDGLFLIYEYVDGRPLTDYIAAGLPLRRALALTLQVVRALAYAHAHRVTHGDLAPSAILVDRAAVARIANVGIAPDEAYFHDTATSAYASEVASDPLATLSPLKEDPERLDTWAAAAILWQLVTDPDPTFSGNNRARTYRADTPEPLREMIERSLQINHPKAITTSTALEAELATLDMQLAASSAESEESIPSTIIALRAARSRAAEAESGAIGITSLRWHGTGAGSVSPNATTSYGEPSDSDNDDPYITHPADPSNNAEYDAQAPRLRLPSRTVGEGAPLLHGAVYAVAPDRAPRQKNEHYGLGGWVWALISLAVFTLCFLAGFFLAPVIALPHLP
jgi:serine/threonine protein kinase